MTEILNPILYAQSLFPIRASLSDATGEADQYGRNRELRTSRISSFAVLISERVHSRGRSGHCA